MPGRAVDQQRRGPLQIQRTRVRTGRIPIASARSLAMCSALSAEERQRVLVTRRKTRIGDGRNRSRTPRRTPRSNGARRVRTGLARVQWIPGGYPPHIAPADGLLPALPDQFELTLDTEASYQGDSQYRPISTEARPEE